MIKQFISNKLKKLAWWANKHSINLDPNYQRYLYVLHYGCRVYPAIENRLACVRKIKEDMQRGKENE